MKGTAQKHCRQEDLLLHYYAELDAQQRRKLTEHLAACAACREEWHRLQRSLDQVPRPAVDLDPGEVKRFAARVAERARPAGRSKLWLWGGALTATAMLALSLIARPPGLFSGHKVQLVADAVVVQELDLLQNMELLEELDLLQDLEGQG